MNGHQGHGAGLLGKQPQDQQEGQDQPEAFNPVAVAVTAQRVAADREGGGSSGCRLPQPAHAADTPHRPSGGEAAESDDAVESSTWQYPPGDKIVPGLYAWAALGLGRRYETWLAWSVARWTAIVVKLPRKDSLTESARRGLAREARIAGKLSHPSIVRLLDSQVGEQATLPHIIYEYVEGPTLETVIDESGPLAPPDVVRLGMQIAAALHYLHGQGVIHLDVKPGNIAIRDGRAILMDFDIALPPGTVRSRTKPRGTPGYMAPEQVRCRPAAVSMDLWALGAVLYEAATGQAAFDPDEQPSGHTYPQLTRPPAPLRGCNPGLPARLQDTITALLHFDPARRPITAMAALRLLAASLPADEESLWPAWADHLIPRASPTSASPPFTHPMPPRSAPGSGAAQL